MIKSIRYLILGTALLAFLATSCLEDPFSTTGETSTVSVQVLTSHIREALQKIAATAAVDRVAIAVTAGDMDTVSQDLAIRDGRAKGDIEVPKGAGRKFVLSGENDGVVLFQAIKIQDINNDQETVTMTIPHADFQAAPDSGIVPMTVQFQDASTPAGAPLTAWSWDFGDGSTSTEASPAHIYQQSGGFSVALTVQDSTGSMHTLRREQYIRADRLPVAKFAALPNTGEAPLTVNFRDFSLPGTADIVSWQWDFGDSTVDSLVQNPSHTYSQAGTYSVRLKIRTAIGTDTKTVEDYVTVNEPGTDPVADFAAEPTEIMVADTVFFTDHSEAGLGGTITDRQWHFGDGDSSNALNPFHIYRVPGDYIASLTVSTSLGSHTKLSSDDTIHVVKPDQAPGDSVITGLGYGDDTPETFVLGEKQDQLLLVHFSAEGYPAELVEVQLYLMGTQNFTLVVLDQLTEEEIARVPAAARDPEGAWHTFNLEAQDITLYGDFYLGIQYTGAPNIDDFWWPALGMDTSTPSAGRSYLYYPGTGGPLLLDQSIYGPGNLLIRAIIKGITQDIKPL